MILYIAGKNHLQQKRAFIQPASTLTPTKNNTENKSQASATALRHDHASGPNFGPTAPASPPEARCWRTPRPWPPAMSHVAGHSARTCPCPRRGTWEQHGWAEVEVCLKLPKSLEISLKSGARFKIRYKTNNFHTRRCWEKKKRNTVRNDGGPAWNSCRMFNNVITCYKILFNDRSIFDADKDQARCTPKGCQRPFLSV